MSADFQNRIGYVDVKSSSVYFDLQRFYDFSTTETPISFDYERLNVDGAMNSTSGKFTAPLDGIYLFSFTRVAYIRLHDTQAPVFQALAFQARAWMS